MKTKVRFPYKLCVIADIDYPNGTFITAITIKHYLILGFLLLFLFLCFLKLSLNSSNSASCFYFVFTCLKLPLTHFKEII